MLLNETLQTVWDASKQHMIWKGIKQYLIDHGHEMGRATYYRKLGTIKAGRRDRLYNIAKDATNNTADRIATFYTLEKMLFEICETADDADKIRAIKEIKELQHDITAYEESTQGSLEQDVRLFGDKKSPEYQIPGQTQSDSPGKNRSSTPKTS